MTRLGPTGFWSYTSQDDSSSRGRLSQLRRLLADEVQQMVGRTPPVHIFQDVAAIPPGAGWEKQIQDALAQSSFLIPVITPGFLQSEWCCKEVLTFHQHERTMGRDDLIFPIYYNDIEDFETLRQSEIIDQSVLRLLRQRQWLEFRDLRHSSPDSEAVARRIEHLANGIRLALFRSVTSPSRDVEVASPQPSSAVSEPSSELAGADAKRPDEPASIAHRPEAIQSPAAPSTPSDGPHAERDEPDSAPTIPRQPVKDRIERNRRTTTWSIVGAAVTGLLLVLTLIYRSIDNARTVEAPPPPPPPGLVPSPDLGLKTFLVFFDWNLATLTPRGEAIVGDAAAYCLRISCKHLDVDGNDDTSQSDGVALALSDKRARIVASTLVRYGVSQDIIITHAFGSKRPLVPTGPGVREPQNRRVEIIFQQ